MNCGGASAEPRNWVTISHSVSVSGPSTAAVTCTPPVPQPYGIGISRLANGTW